MSQARFLFFLEICVCACAFVRGYAPTSSSFCHIKTGQSGSGPPIFFLFTQIFTVMDTVSFVGGNTVLYFVLLPHRNISESTQRFQRLIPKDSVTFQQAERAPGLRPGRGQRNAGREREERNAESRAEVEGVLIKVGNERNAGRDTVGVSLRKLKGERIRVWQERKDLETE